MGKARFHGKGFLRNYGHQAALALDVDPKLLTVLPDGLPSSPAPGTLALASPGAASAALAPSAASSSSGSVLKGEREGSLPAPPPLPCPLCTCARALPQISRVFQSKNSNKQYSLYSRNKKSTHTVCDLLGSRGPHIRTPVFGGNVPSPQQMFRPQRTCLEF